MKLLVSVVNRHDVYGLTDALMQAKHSATVISTTGGFLREGNATLLMGVEDERVAQVLGIIQEHCHTRTQYVTPLPAGIEYEEAFALAPLEVEVGGAIVFILDVERFERY